MLVYFSTVVRGATIADGGELVALDWDSKAVLVRAPVAPSDPDEHEDNPRGGTRGGRGILVQNGEVLVASYDTLLVFDKRLQLRRQLTNPYFANLHELSWEGRDIWASSTSSDVAVKVDLSGATIDTWWPREDAVVSERFGLARTSQGPPMNPQALAAYQRETSNGRTHLNAVTAWEDRPLVALNRHGCIVRLNPTEIFIHDPNLRGCHNVVVAADGHILVNNSVGRSIEVFDFRGRRVGRHDLTRLPLVRSILRRHTGRRIQAWLARHGRPQGLFRRWFGEVLMARTVFVRGLCLTPRETVLVGISPAAVLELDWKTGRLIDHFEYSDDVRVCVHGLAMVASHSSTGC